MDGIEKTDPLLSGAFLTERGELLIDRALHQLETVGVPLSSEDGLNLFESNGAIKERREGRVLIRARAVRRVMEKLPAAFNLFDQTGRKVATLAGANGVRGRGDSGHRNDGNKDNGGGSPPLFCCTTRADGNNRSIDELLPQIDVAVDAIAAAGQFEMAGIAAPGGFTDFYAVYKTIKATQRPLLLRLDDPDCLDGIRNLLCVVAGTPQRLEQKPMAIVEVCQPETGVWDEKTFRIICDNARLGIPIALISDPAGNGIGDLITTTAASLTALLFHQYAFMSAPLIWGVPFFAPATTPSPWQWDLLLAAGQTMGLPLLATYPRTERPFTPGDNALLALQAAIRGVNIIAWGGAGNDGGLDPDRVAGDGALLSSIRHCSVAAVVGVTTSGDRIDKSAGSRAHLSEAIDNRRFSAETERKLDEVAAREAARHNITLPD